MDGEQGACRRRRGERFPEWSSVNVPARGRRPGPNGRPGQVAGVQHSHEDVVEGVVGPRFNHPHREDVGRAIPGQEGYPSGRSVVESGPDRLEQ